MRSRNCYGISKFGLPVRIDAIVAIVIMALAMRVCKSNAHSISDWNVTGN